MAGDWIKMRSDLLTSPKVVRMSSALGADRFRIVGGLLSAWSLFDAHSIDGRLSGYDAKSLNSLAAWDGFAEAMIAVGWLEVDGDALVLPRFDAHNGASAKRRAQDSDRKRASRNVSADEADKKRTREEKRREEKKQQKDIGAAAPFAPPDWVDASAWTDFEEMRLKIKKPMTDRARQLIVLELEKLRSAGHSVKAVLESSTRNNWQDVYAPKDKSPVVTKSRLVTPAAGAEYGAM